MQRFTPNEEGTTGAGDFGNLTIMVNGIDELLQFLSRALWMETAAGAAALLPT